MDSDLLQRITMEAGKCGGHPCIRGLRMRVTDVLELLAQSNLSIVDVRKFEAQLSSKLRA